VKNWGCAHRCPVAEAAAGNLLCGLHLRRRAISLTLALIGIATVAAAWALLAAEVVVGFPAGEGAEGQNASARGLLGWGRLDSTFTPRPALGITTDHPGTSSAMATAAGRSSAAVVGSSSLLRPMRLSHPERLAASPEARIFLRVNAASGKAVVGQEALIGEHWPAGAVLQVFRSC